ncbi:858_t:CDS:1 [Paraglomus brasilianum]|uniref:858_t:CDS:1 n=1 Tax=Paraglomus brasilianum TaxID=144538 RepID=A0A9N9BX05_9GLOM|nr:858_t:CDS:1 [Paraglomus brasilianum]
MATSNTLFAFIILILTTIVFVHADTNATITATLSSNTVFCTFLPPTPGEYIADSELTGIAFCTASTPGVVNVIPDGFVISANFAGDPSTYVQITGKMNPDAYQLHHDDEGGQYDSNGSPPDASCSGYEYFVNLVEPNDGNYCIRCCHNKKDCPTNESTEGCETVIPGIY